MAWWAGTIPLPEAVTVGSEARLCGCSGSVGVGVAVTSRALAASAKEDAKEADRIVDLARRIKIVGRSIAKQ